ncbi:ABC transporter ATP-binding protein [Marispirochaeta aestuarii]|uniref:ABC transporter ATP-binding protein n=1 Tax=Marispirochaeta aestuarii TaxID=1963862 RepID=UPI0029C6A81E|nr:ABC transporter ATP-binding protein [Marispirochaeta aestuarii]
MMTHVLQAAGIVKNYATLRALDGIGIQAAKGEITGLIGPDGAGKSSFMKIVLGLLKRDSGDLRLFGSDPLIDRSAVRKGVGYMPEVFSLYTDLSVDENLRFSFQIHRGRMSEYPGLRERLYRFNRLEDFAEARAGTLSGGMKQKLALSCALMHSPELLILDEPTTGVDPLSREEFWTMLKELKNSGITILVSTPYMEEALQCDHIYLMNRGRVLEQGNPDRLTEDFPGRIIEIDAVPEDPRVVRQRLQQQFPGTPVYLAGRRVHLSFSGEEEQIGQGRRVKPDLEDLFLTRIMEEEGADP